MKIIGITGGIGSGKSMVCKIFATLGVPVFYADDEAKLVYEDPWVKEKVIALLGAGSYTASGLDRTYVAKKVFSDEMLLDKLNYLIHPAVQKRFVAWCETQKEAPYVLKEAAILFESGHDTGTDAVILVKAPVEIKIERILKRDKISKEEIERRMKAQWDDESKEEHSDFVIQNDEHEAVIPQVLKVHAQLIATKNSRS